MQGEVRDTSSTLRGGARMSTKLASLTLRAREDPKCRFTSLMHLLTEDFLMECFWELKRGKSPGIDRVTVEEYTIRILSSYEEVLLKSPVLEIWTLGSVRDVKQSVGLLKMSTRQNER